MEEGILNMPSMSRALSMVKQLLQGWREGEERGNDGTSDISIIVWIYYSPKIYNASRVMGDFSNCDI